MTTPLYLVYGGDEYLVSAKAKEIIRQLIPPENEALGLETINGNISTVDDAVSSLRQCDEAARTLGFFGTQKVVWFRDVNFLSEKKSRPGKSDQVKAAVADLTALLKQGLPEGVTLLVTSPAVDKRFAFYKACKATGEIHEFAVSEKAWQNEKEARARTMEILAGAGLRMPAPVLDAFLAKVGTSTRQIVNEIEKMAVYVKDRTDVSMEDVERVICASREALAWDLADAFGEQELERALRILRQLTFQKESPIRLVAALQNRVRELLVYRQALDANWISVSQSQYKANARWENVPPEIDRILSEDFLRDPRSTHPFRVGILAGQAKRFSMPHLRRCQRQLLDTHVKLVSSSLPKSMALELLLIRMLSA